MIQSVAVKFKMISHAEDELSRSAPYRDIISAGRCLMKYWFDFWIACFILAGSAFALIALIVLVRGAADLRQMFTRFEAHTRSDDRSAGDFRS